MYCMKCGINYPDGVANCANCGSILMEMPYKQSSGKQATFTAAESRTSSLAIFSFVIGLLCIAYPFFSLSFILWPFLILLAVICSVTALVKINRSKGQLDGTALAITGILPPIIISLIICLNPLFAYYLFREQPTYSVSDRVTCATTLKGLHTAIRIYVNDYDEKLPTENWCDLLIKEVDVSPKSFICPSSDAIEGESSYATNKYIAGKKLDTLPGDVVLLFETNKGLEEGPRNTPIQTRRHYDFVKELKVYKTKTKVYKDRFNQFGGPEDLLLHHNDNESGQKGCNVLFTDGHVEYVTEDRIADLKWTVE